MTPDATRRWRTTARLAVGVGVGLAMGAVGAWAFGVRVNYTSSLPRGLYVASAFDPASAEPGQIVAACPSADAAAALAPYLANGPCPGGVVELGKPLAGLPGDTVVVDSVGVRVGGTLLPNSAPLFRDRAGNPLRPRLGRHVLGEGEYWLHSGRVPTSVDSRYAGPVSDVRGVLRPIWVEGGVRDAAGG